MNPFPRGFVALLSVLTISSILLVTSLSADAKVSLAQQAVANEYSYRAAQQAAYSCAQLAANRVSVEPQRFEKAGTTTIILSPDHSNPLECSIISAHGTSTIVSMVVQGHVGDSVIRMHAMARRTSSTSPFQISFKRI
jgi:hypothetical protein